VKSFDDDYDDYDNDNNDYYYHYYYNEISGSVKEGKFFKELIIHGS
jgi:hypothetical protein